MRGIREMYIRRERLNTINSRICGLPEEIILEIMSHMRPADLYFIRQVSRFFSRIFHTKRFSIYGNSVRKTARPRTIHWTGGRNAVQLETPRLSSRVFRVPSYVSVNEERADPRASWHCRRFMFGDHDFQFPLVTCECHKEVRETLVKRALCKPCLERRCKTTFKEHCRFNMQQAWCSGCKAWHPHMWFPVDWAEPDGPYAPALRCITWEGRVQMCPHLEFTWKDVLKWASIASNDKSGHADGFHSTVFACTSCFGPGRLSTRAQRPEIRYVRRKQREAPSTLELTWKAPLSLVRNAALREDFDDILCPHLTWADIRKGIWPSERKGVMVCTTCDFRYHWHRENQSAETYVEGHYILWGSLMPKSAAPARLWLLLHPRSYRWNEISRHVLWCTNDGCYNAKGEFRKILRDTPEHVYR